MGESGRERVCESGVEEECQDLTMHMYTVGCVWRTSKSTTSSTQWQHS